MSTEDRKLSAGPRPRRFDPGGALAKENDGQSQSNTLGNQVRERFRSIVERVPIPARNTYVYQSIDHDHEIRILKVFHGKKNSALECMLFATLLPDPKSTSATLERYRALSYVWGQDKPAQKITIFYDTGGRGKLQSMTPFNRSGSFYIGENLAAALKQLRQEDHDINLWVDALCIDQKNIKERSSQVQLMAQIYTEAESLCVWLGEGQEHKIKETLHFLKYVDDLQSWGDIIENTNGWNLVFKLLENDYFRRIWGVQELALSKRAILRWGSEEIEWSTFSNALSLLNCKRDEIVKELLKTTGTPLLVANSTAALDNLDSLCNQTINSSVLNSGYPNGVQKRGDRQVLVVKLKYKRRMGGDIQRILALKPRHSYAFLNAEPKHFSRIENVTSFTPTPLGGQTVKFEDLEDTDSDISIASLESFTASTTATSATSLSDMLPVARDSAKEIANLISNDDQLRKLLDEAFDSLEPERVTRNFRRALRSFSEELINEAGTVPQEQAAKFVGQKSRQIAILVRQNLRPIKQLLLSSQGVDELRQERLQTYLVGSQDASGLEIFDTTMKPGVGEEDSDEEEAENDVADNHPDLTKLREWLLTASAMQALRDRFRLFLYPEKPTELKRSNITEIEAEAREKLRIFQTLPHHIEDNALQNQEPTGEARLCLEPKSNHASSKSILAFLESFYTIFPVWSYTSEKKSLKSGVVRLEWICACGHTSYDDFTELQPGAVARYAENLIQSGYATHAQSTYQSSAPTTTFITAARNRIIAAGRHMSSLKPNNEGKRLKKARKFAKIQCSPTPEVTCKWLHLCLKKRPNAKVTILEPLHVCKDDEQQDLTDATFFQLLRKTWKTQRTWTDLILFKLARIEFIKFSAFPDDAVDRIVPDMIPPTTEHYDFAPPPPLEMVPPIAAEHMVHLVQAECTPTMKNTSFYLSQLPKKKDKPLKFTTLTHLGPGINIGYGLRFAEAPDSSFIVTFLFVMAVVVGTVFGVCWSVFKKDFQHAWTISAYFVSLVALAVVTWQVRATS